MNEVIPGYWIRTMRLRQDTVCMIKSLNGYTILRINTN